jgi:hypothetical protein
MIRNNAINLIDYLGMSYWSCFHISKEKCETKVSEWKATNKETLDALSKKGCNLNIICSCCELDADDKGCYTPNSPPTTGGTTTICYDSIFWASTVTTTLEHEGKHFSDLCQYKIDTDDCSDMLCAEMRVKFADGSCHDRTSCWAIVGLVYGTQYDACKGTAYTLAAEKCTSKCNLGEGPLF